MRTSVKFSDNLIMNYQAEPFKPVYLHSSSLNKTFSFVYNEKFIKVIL
jgi:hypothetical protein